MSGPAGDCHASPPGGRARLGAEGLPAGHRLAPHTADCIIEAWGTDLASCCTEALQALVEEFARPNETAATRALPLSGGPASAEDLLVSLLEDVLYVVDVFSVVPVRFHLSETEDGGLAGCMEVVDVEQASVVGPPPKAISYHGLSVAPLEGRWRCRVLVDV